MRLVRDAVLTAIGAATLFAVAHTAAVAVYHIPSESMVPTLEVGDSFTVSKYAYGWSRYSIPFGEQLPFSFTGRVLAGTPKRGDVVVFAHPRSKRTMVKRVLARPGDRIAFKGGQLILNGRAVERRIVGAYRIRAHDGDVVSQARFIEQLPEAAPYAIVLTPGRPHGRDMAEIVVPPGHYFVTGDNRDNSADSRYPDMGLIPADHLIGRAETILFSVKQCADEPGLTCAPRRYLTAIN